jgi:transposase
MGLPDGYFVDMCRGANVPEVQVANPRDPAWRNRTSKTDRQDADLLAQLSASGPIRTVHVPEDHIRQWRVLIDYRHKLVHRRTRIKNRIKALLRNRGMPTGTLWNAEGMARLHDLALPMNAFMS